MNNWGLAPIIHTQRLLLVPLADRHLDLLVRHAFLTVGVRRVIAQTMAVNAASRGVMTSVGLSYVRTYFPDFEEPLPGADQGELEYELTFADWLEAR